MGSGPSVVVAHPVVLVVSLVAATAVLVWLAAIASEHGLGNGFVTLFAAGGLIAAGRQLVVDDAAGFNPLVERTGPYVLAALFAVTVGTVCAWLATRRFRQPGTAATIAAPVAGVVPLIGIAAVLVPIMLLANVLNVPVEWFDWTAPGHPDHARNVLLIAFAASVGLGWALSRPRPAAAALGRMTGAKVPPATRAFWWATAISTLVVLAIAAASLPVGEQVPGSLRDTLAIVIVAVAGVDLVASWRAHRRADLVGVWPIHQLALADVAVEVLAKHGITAHLRGRATRALFHVFGPFVPVEVMVPADRAGEATAHLRDLFDPAARGSTTAW
jgi:hypothetical protein